MRASILLLALGANLASAFAGAQAYGRLVLEGYPPSANLMLPSQGLACLNLPEPILQAALPPGVAAQTPSPTTLCLQALDTFQPAPATLTTSRGKLVLNLTGGGEAATYTVAYAAPPQTEPEKPKEAKPQASPPADQPGGARAAGSPPAPEPPKPASGPRTLPPSSAEAEGFLLRGSLEYREDGSLRLHFLLVNRGTLPAVLKLPRISLALNGQALEGSAPTQLAFSSGKQEWLPPGGSVQGTFTLDPEKVRRIFPKGKLALRIQPVVMDENLSSKSLVLTWSLDWYPVASTEGGNR